MIPEFQAIVRELGLLTRPLFRRVGRRGKTTARRAHDSKLAEDSIVLDGVTASFVLSIRPGGWIQEDEDYYDWAWSSHVPHHIELLPDAEGDGLLLLRRWDAPSYIRRFKLPNVIRNGPTFLSELERHGQGKAPSVITFALRFFQQLREVLDKSDDTHAITVFHSLLLAATQVRSGSTERIDPWRQARTLGECLKIAGIPIPSLDLSNIRLGGIQAGLLQADPASGRHLDASLLLQHASGTLYQEAHLALDRRAVQLSLGIAGPMPGARTWRVSRDVVFTPPGLARVLVDFAWHHLRRPKKSKNRTTHIRVLDPACGSGVFLIEVLTHLHQDLDITREETLELLGFDKSAKAVEMARLSLDYAVNGGEQGQKQGRRGHLVLRIAEQDALACNWPSVDMVVMNPPFIAWNDLTEEQRAHVRAECGDLYSGRPDIAIGFITKAVKTLHPGGVLVTLLPSSLLEAHAGVPWRRWLAQECLVHLVGRFRGNELFPNVLVEPSVLVLQKRDAGQPSAATTTQADRTIMLLSSPGGADAALRAVRKGSTEESVPDRFDLYSVPGTQLSRDSWLPRPYALRDLIQKLETAKAPRIGELFAVKQGIRSGAKHIFILTSAELSRLPKRERQFFRPLAGNATIRNAQLAFKEAIFYPFTTGLPNIASEEELERVVPTFYRQRLLPNKKSLTGRSGVTAHWWSLTRPRNWQHGGFPKLVSSYFGAAGKFAWDESGEYVVGQGFAWLPRAGAEPIEDSPEESSRRTIPTEVISAEAAPAYLALLNSRLFQQLLSYYSYRVMGGQFDLSPRFIDQIPIPNLFSAEHVSWEVFNGLTRMGRSLHSGIKALLSPDIDQLVAEAYGIPFKAWPNEDL